MNKKNNFASFAIVAISVISLCAANLVAQNKVAVAKKQMPTANATTDKVLQTYIDISSLTMEKRQEIFSRLSKEDKASIFKLHLALQFAKRRNLSQEQKDLILEWIPLITPEKYDSKNVNAGNKAEQEASVIEAKSRTLFQGKDAFEIFAKLGGNDADGGNLKKYQSLIASPFLPTGGMCLAGFRLKKKVPLLRYTLHIS